MAALYGTSIYGGTGGTGTVFELQNTTGRWAETVLHSFSGGSDGENPMASLIFDKSGNLYGTTFNGGDSLDGIVFMLKPSKGGWTETVPYSFNGSSAGGNPSGPLIFDESGRLYGTAGLGPHDAGVVFRLTHSKTGWTETVLYSFTGFRDGGSPFTGVLRDGLGHLFGTTVRGGKDFLGVVFEVTP